MGSDSIDRTASGASWATVAAELVIDGPPSTTTAATNPDHQPEHDRRAREAGQLPRPVHRRDRPIETDGDEPGDREPHDQRLRR